MKHFKLSLLAAAAVVTVAAMPSMAATPKSVLVVAERIDDIISLDPAQSFEFTGNEIDRNVYSFLINTDPLNLEAGYGPDLASSWEVSEDGMTITFKIAEGREFASGNPITAKDAAFSLQRVILLNKTPSFILSQFGFTPENVKEKIVATDDYTLSITTDKPYAVSFVLNCLTANVAAIVDSKLVMENEVDGDLGNDWLRNHSAGSGAYTLKSLKPNESVVLAANPKWWGAAPAMKQIFIRQVAESASQRLLLEKGDVDVARNLSTEDVAAVSEVEGLKIHSELRGRIMYWAANQKNEILSNTKVLEALKYLTDYEGMSSSFLKGQYSVHQSFLPLTYLGALEDNPYSLDIEKGKALLAEAGYPDGFEINAIVREAQERIDIAQSLQNTWGKAGVKLSLTVGTGAQTLDKYRAREHDIYVGAWGPDYPDPNTNAGTFALNPGNADDAGNTGYLAWRNAWDIPGYSERTLAAVVENDVEKRKQMYLDLQKDFQKDSPFGIMFQQTEQAGLQDSVNNFSIGGAITTTSYWQVTKD
ncbi:ABC transporter substrate-binding protein [uncultured Cohaesibacter sp.]|uniref:ABC transporter substrate-binding protein n=1 Tax=uncultured Cohaesibacter sp. TaxID=1002546 RepID=UPI00292FCC15|nr:ABC transporter substrate-binding protein [uncultured Cohaesibacter sp.]